MHIFIFIILCIFSVNIFAADSGGNVVIDIIDTEEVTIHKGIVSLYYRSIVILQDDHLWIWVKITLQQDIINKIWERIKNDSGWLQFRWVQFMCSKGNTQLVCLVPLNAFRNEDYSFKKENEVINIKIANENLKLKLDESCNRLDALYYQYVSTSNTYGCSIQ